MSKTAVVTGGNVGIGRAISVALARCDAAWRVSEHRGAADPAHDFALVFALTDERAYADAAGAMLSQYAHHYSN